MGISGRMPTSRKPVSLVHYSYFGHVATYFYVFLVSALWVMNDIQANTDRILNTPLPLAYAIAISQLTWVYILILPFQLYTTLGLVAIPGTLCKPPLRSIAFSIY
jgi:predicted membrane chloride channel (bestrophin family)